MTLGKSLGYRVMIFIFKTISTTLPQMSILLAKRLSHGKMRHLIKSLPTVEERRRKIQTWILNAFCSSPSCFSVRDSTSWKIKWYIYVAFFLFSINYPRLTSMALCIWGWPWSPDPPASASLVPVCASLFSGQFYFLKDRNIFGKINMHAHCFCVFFPQLFIQWVVDTWNTGINAPLQKKAAWNLPGSSEELSNTSSGYWCRVWKALNMFF